MIHALALLLMLMPALAQAQMRLMPPDNLRCESDADCTAVEGVCRYNWVVVNRVSTAELLDTINDLRARTKCMAYAGKLPFPTVKCKMQQCVEVK